MEIPVSRPETPEYGGTCVEAGDTVEYGRDPCQGLRHCDVVDTRIRANISHCLI